MSEQKGLSGGCNDKQLNMAVISGDTTGTVTEDLLTSITGDLNAVQKKKVLEFREIEGAHG